MKRTGRIAAVCLGLALWAVPAAANSVSEAWSGEVIEGLMQSRYSVETLQAEVGRLERELAEAKKDIAARPQCYTLDCAAMRPVFQRIVDLDQAAQAAVLVSYLAQRQRERFAVNQRGGLKAIRGNAEQIKSILFRQEILTKVMDLTINIGAGVAYGKVTELRELVAQIAHSIANYGISQGINAFVPWSKTGSQISATALGQGDDQGPAGTIARKIGGKLSAFGFLSHKGKGEIAFEPHFYSTKVYEQSKPIRPGGDPVKNLKPGKISNVITTAVVAAIMESITNEMRGHLREAIGVLAEAESQEQEAIRIAVLQKYFVTRMQEVRRDVTDLMSRFGTLARDCEMTLATKSCAARYKAALDAAEANLKASVGTAQARRTEAAERVERARGEWLGALNASSAAREKLSRLRDQLATREYFEKNRFKIEEMANNAADPNLREKYRQERAAGLELPESGLIRAEIAKLEETRGDGNARIDSLRAEVREMSAAALKIFATSDDAVARAERAYIADTAKAEKQFADCMDKPRTFAPPVAQVSLDGVRNAYHGDIYPDHMFGALKRALDETEKSIGAAEIGIIVKPSAECAPKLADRPDINGCWKRGDAAWIVRERGGHARVAVREGGVTGKVLYNMAGRYDGKGLDLLPRAPSDIRKRFDVTPAGLPGSPMSAYADFGYHLAVVHKDNRGVMTLAGPDWRYLVRQLGTEWRETQGGARIERQAVIGGYEEIAVNALERLHPVPEKLRVTGKGFGRDVGELTAATPFWLELRGRDACPMHRDRVLVMLTSTIDGGATRRIVALEETEPGAGIYRSGPEGIVFDRIFPVNFTRTQYDSARQVGQFMGLDARIVDQKSEDPIARIPFSPKGLPKGDPYSISSPVIVEPGLQYSADVDMIAALSASDSVKSRLSLRQVPERFMRHSAKARVRVESRLSYGVAAIAFNLRRMREVIASGADKKGEYARAESYLRSLRPIVENALQRVQTAGRSAPTDVGTPSLWRTKILREIALWEDIIRELRTLPFPFGDVYYRGEYRASSAADNLERELRFYRTTVASLMGLDLSATGGGGIAPRR